jgi:V/A-type H+-transporting ATPase subunit I
VSKALFINHALPMEKVRVITLKDSAEQAMKTLQKAGVLHVEEAKELKPVDRETIERARKEVTELLNFANTVLSYVPEAEKTISGKDFDVIYTRPFNEISDEIKLVYNKAHSLSERIIKLESEIKQKNDVRKYLEPVTAGSNLGLSDLNYNGDYLVARVFVMSAESFRSIEDRLKKLLFENTVATVEAEIICHAIAERKNLKAIETIIGDAGGRFMEFPAEKGTVKEYLEANESQIVELQSKKNELSAELIAKVGQDVNRTILLREALLAEEERLSVLTKAAEAKYITLIEGWVPQTEVEKLSVAVKQDIPNAYVDARAPEGTEQPPTKQDNYEGVTPFSLIVGLFGIPKYREWDPTPIVAYSFALFFGVMTADVLYALGIAAFAHWVLPKFVDDPKSEGIRLFKRVLYTSAAVSFVLGLLSGSWLADFFPSVFGIEMPSFAPVAEAFGNPITFIIVACVIGFIHVNIAHAFALIQGIQAKNKGVIVTKIGFFLMQIFVILLAIAAAGIVPALVGMSNIFLYCSYASLAMLIIGVIMQVSYFGVLMWIFEITGLVGDILSYSRLAGVGMAGFYLGKAINMLSNIMRTLIPGPIGLVVGILIAIGVLIVGHPSTRCSASRVALSTPCGSASSSSCSNSMKEVVASTARSALRPAGRYS